GRFFGRSFFDVQLLQRGIDLSQGREKVLLQQHMLREYLQSDFVAVAPDMTIAQARQIMGARNVGEAYVIAPDNRFLGVLQSSHLLALSDRADAMEETVSAHLAPPQLVFSLQTTIWDAMEGMADFVGETIPVLSDDDDEQLAGIVTEAMIIHASVEISRRLRQEENATG
ncbi:MAG TPA: chloride ion channel, partial [Alphaproteobacteria bacterium]|nr:chloride ion channel [Alphaproteobacteria bacterium]